MLKVIGVALGTDPVVGVFAATGDAVPFTTDVDAGDAPAMAAEAVKPRVPDTVATANISRVDRRLMVQPLFCRRTRPLSCRWHGL
jgi:hypothetical protein